MNYLFYALIVLAFGGSLAATVYIARMLNARRAAPQWVLLVWLLGLILVVGLGVLQVDTAFIIMGSFLVLSLFYQYIIGLSTGSAIIVNIAAISSLAILFSAVIFTAGKAHMQDIRDFVLTNAPPSQFIKISSARTKVDEMLGETAYEEDEPVFYKEDDLLPAAAVAQRTKKPVPVHMYRALNPYKAHSAIGYQIRLQKRDGTLIKGSIKNVRNGKIILMRYVKEGRGMVEAPVSMSSIRKLEVYQ
jgi:hypothetical protein